VRLGKGERVRIESPGGGGYGPPEERARDALARDLALGYATPEHVAKNYSANLSSVMPGLVPGIHVLNTSANKDVDGRDKPGHDE
jgi:N-methylhydantoinase B/oxoprolinase/acetone carboxylase alpha subunit